MLAQLSANARRTRLRSLSGPPADPCWADGTDITLIDSLTAQKRLAQAGFGLALVSENSVRDELRQGTLVALDIPSMRTAIPITAIHRRNGYLSSAAKTLLKLLTEGVSSGANSALRQLTESSE
jgi:DNA-binding transcriptional LysR family regulator